MADITAEIIFNGVRTGYYPIEFGKGVNIQLPLMNAPEELSAEVQKIVDDILSGDIVVVKDATPIEQ